MYLAGSSPTARNSWSRRRSGAGQPSTLRLYRCRMRTRLSGPPRRPLLHVAAAASPYSPASTAFSKRSLDLWSTLRPEGTLKEAHLPRTPPIQGRPLTSQHSRIREGPRPHERSAAAPSQDVARQGAQVAALRRRVEDQGRAMLEQQARTSLLFRRLAASDSRVNDMVRRWREQRRNATEGRGAGSGV